LNALKQNKNNVTKTTEFLLNISEDNKQKSKWGYNYGNNVDLKSAKKRFLRILKESTEKVDPMSNNNATEKQHKKIG